MIQTSTNEVCESNDQRFEKSQEEIWVIKIGSAMITNDGHGLDYQRILEWVAQIAQLMAQGKKIMVVSSGAIAEGMLRLHWSVRPHLLNELQAAAAVGQMGLLHAWEQAFASFNLKTAQVLLTHEDAAHRNRYLNIRATLTTLMHNRVVPIINENDVVAFEEIRFGDNDTLGALVTNLIEAGLYIILTDQQGMYDQDPRQYPNAKLLSSARALAPQLLKMAGSEGGRLGRGGMLTKVKAARRAAQSGAATWIAYGRTPNVLLKMANAEPLGTLLLPDHTLFAARKRWLMSHIQSKGKLCIDYGAIEALQNGGKSLLPIGIMSVEGDFKRGDLVLCVDEKGIEIGRGLSNYSAYELARIMRLHSDQIQECLGFIIAEEAIHRNHFVLTQLIE